jgi:DNA polymerase-3 subunit alpha
VVGDNEIRFGLAAIKNVGEGAVEAILDTRRKTGAFKSVFDFCERVDFKAVNRRVLESFVKSGTFDSLHDRKRAALMGGLDHAMEAGQKKQRDDALGQGSLFGAMAAAGPAHVEKLADAPDWPESERLNYEKESLGFFVSGHPLERFAAELRTLATCTVGKVQEKNNTEVVIGGIITALRPLKTKKGDRMATFLLEDTEGAAEVLVFPKTYEQVQQFLANDVVVLVKGKAECEDDSKARILAETVTPLDKARVAEARFVTIRVSAGKWDAGSADRLRDILGSNRGECAVTLTLAGVPIEVGALAQAVGGDHMPSLVEHDVVIALPAYSRVRASSTLQSEVESLFGAGCLTLSRTAHA